MADVLAHNPLLLLFVCLAIGSAAGAVRTHGFALGPAAVLFTALGLSAWDGRLALPQIMGSLGLALFAYCVGIASGPSFFGALRHNLPAVAAVVAVLGGCAVVTRVVGGLMDLPGDVVAGVYAGGLTNTPALAAATEKAHGAAGATVGYSVTYLGGVLVMLAVAAWALGRRAPTGDDDTDPRQKLVVRTLQVTTDDLPPLGEMAYDAEHPVVFSRVKHGDDLAVAHDSDHLHPGDLVAAVGREEDVRAVTERIGRRADEPLTLDRRQLDMRRIALSNRSLSGRTIAQLGLNDFQARATRVRRGDVDLMARPDMRVHQGDRIRVIAPRERMPELSRHLGDSERGPGDLNPVGLSIGLAAGLALGTVGIPVPGAGTLTLGVAAGPLLVGLLLGRLARTGPVVWSLPYTASHLMQNLGILIFLAAAGSHAGGDLMHALHGGAAPRIALTGLLLTALFAASLVLIARAFGLGGPRLAGLVAGAQTQPAVLAFAQERTGGDQRVALGYALVFPAAMITKILAATLLAGMG